MKKVIIFIALTLSVGAMAKNLEQLTAEWNQLTDRKSRIEFVQTNVSDIKEAYKTNGYKTTGSFGLFSATYWHTNAFDLSGADQVTIKFKFYNAAMSRHKTSQTLGIDSMYVSLNKKIRDSETVEGSNSYDIARPGLLFYRYQRFPLIYLCQAHIFL